MDALSWTIDRKAHLVTIRGIGVFDLPFIKSFRDEMWREGAVGLCKLIDLSRADIQLSESDFQQIATTIRTGRANNKGPIAIVVGKTPPPLLVDMAVLLKNRISLRRRLRLFADEADAREWLASEAKVMALAGSLSSLMLKNTFNPSADC
jgi:hypothetical protein